MPPKCFLISDVYCFGGSFVILKRPWRLKKAQEVPVQKSLIEKRLHFFVIFSRSSFKTHRNILANCFFFFCPLKTGFFLSFFSRKKPKKKKWGPLFFFFHFLRCAILIPATKDDDGSGFFFENMLREVPGTYTSTMM